MNDQTLRLKSALVHLQKHFEGYKAQAIGLMVPLVQNPTRAPDESRSPTDVVQVRDKWIALIGVIKLALYSHKALLDHKGEIEWKPLDRCIRLLEGLEEKGLDAAKLIAAKGASGYRLALSEWGDEG